MKKNTMTFAPWAWESENWGGDPEGPLAKALERARKQKPKPLKLVNLPHKGQKSLKDFKAEATHIDWETDGQEVDLPKTVKVPDDLDVDEIADYLSDEYDFLVNSFQIKDAESFEADENHTNKDYENMQKDLNKFVNTFCKCKYSKGAPSALNIYTSCGYCGKEVDEVSFYGLTKDAESFEAEQVRCVSCMLKCDREDATVMGGRFICDVCQEDDFYAESFEAPIVGLGPVTAECSSCGLVDFINCRECIICQPCLHDGKCSCEINEAESFEAEGCDHVYELDRDLTSLLQGDGSRYGYVEVTVKCRNCGDSRWGSYGVERDLEQAAEEFRADMSKKGKDFVSKKIATIMVEWKKTGKIGNSTPKNAKAAQQQAIAVAFSMAARKGFKGVKKGAESFESDGYFRTKPTCKCGGEMQWDNVKKAWFCMVCPYNQYQNNAESFGADKGLGFIINPASIGKGLPTYWAFDVDNDQVNYQTCLTCTQPIDYEIDEDDEFSGVQCKSCESKYEYREYEVGDKVGYYLKNDAESFEAESNCAKCGATATILHDPKLEGTSLTSPVWLCSDCHQNFQRYYSESFEAGEDKKIKINRLNHIGKDIEIEMELSEKGKKYIYKGVLEGSEGCVKCGDKVINIWEENGKKMPLCKECYLMHFYGAEEITTSKITIDDYIPKRVERFQDSILFYIGEYAERRYAHPWAIKEGLIERKIIPDSKNPISIIDPAGISISDVEMILDNEWDGRYYLFEEDGTFVGGEKHYFSADEYDIDVRDIWTPEREVIEQIKYDSNLKDKFPLIDKDSYWDSTKINEWTPERQTIEEIRGDREYREMFPMLGRHPGYYDDSGYWVEYQDEYREDYSSLQLPLWGQILVVCGGAMGIGYLAKKLDKSQYP